MKKIEIKGNPVGYLTKSWLLPSIFISFVVADFLIMHKPNYGTIAWAITWSLIVLISRNSTKNSEYSSGFSLEFGNTDIVCKHNNSIFWHIPYNRISHFAVEPANNSSWLSPKNSLTRIYTKDGDSYSIPVQINAEQNEEIRLALERAIA